MIVVFDMTVCCLLFVMCVYVCMLRVRLACAILKHNDDGIVNK